MQTKESLNLSIFIEIPPSLYLLHRLSFYFHRKHTDKNLLRPFVECELHRTLENDVSEIFACSSVVLLQTSFRRALVARTNEASEISMQSIWNLLHKPYLPIVLNGGISVLALLHYKLVFVQSNDDPFNLIAAQSP